MRLDPCNWLGITMGTLVPNWFEVYNDCKFIDIWFVYHGVHVLSASDKKQHWYGLLYTIGLLYSNPTMWLHNSYSQKRSTLPDYRHIMNDKLTNVISTVCRWNLLINWTLTNSLCFIMSNNQKILRENLFWTCARLGAKNFSRFS